MEPQPEAKKRGKKPRIRNRHKPTEAINEAEKASPRREGVRTPTQIIASKDAEFVTQRRCPVCWHSLQHCICSAIEPLAFRKNVYFFVYMHYLEYGNAGDDAKMMRNAAPDRTQLFLHGREGEGAVLLDGTGVPVRTMSNVHMHDVVTEPFPSLPV